MRTHKRYNMRDHQITFKKTQTRTKFLYNIRGNLQKTGDRWHSLCRLGAGRCKVPTHPPKTKRRKHLYKRARCLYPIAIPTANFLERSIITRGSMCTMWFARCTFFLATNNAYCSFLSSLSSPDSSPSDFFSSSDVPSSYATNSFISPRTSSRNIIWAFGNGNKTTLTTATGTTLLII